MYIEKINLFVLLTFVITTTYITSAYINEQPKEVGSKTRLLILEKEVPSNFINTLKPQPKDVWI